MDAIDSRNDLTGWAGSPHCVSAFIPIGAVCRALMMATWPAITYALAYISSVDFCLLAITSSRQLAHQLAMLHGPRYSP